MFDTRFRKEAILLFVFGLGIVLTILFTPSCGSTPLNRVKIVTYAGDSESGGITRAQDNHTIRCDSEEINQYICMSYDDLKAILLKIKRCKSWDVDPI